VRWGHVLMIEAPGKASRCGRGKVEDVKFRFTLKAGTSTGARVTATNERARAFFPNRMGEVSISSCSRGRHDCC
jgi:hypothetical protein